MPAVPREAFSAVVSAVGEALEREGFQRQGFVFRLIKENNCGVVEFQQSVKSSEDVVLFTVNLGIVYGDLLSAGSFQIQKARAIDAHLRVRVGMLLPDRPDKWWEINVSTDCDSLIRELSALLLAEGSPYVKRYLDPEAVITLWESGQSPGLTAVQRNRFLTRLIEKRRGRI